MSTGDVASPVPSFITNQLKLTVTHQIQTSHLIFLFQAKS